MPIKKVTLTNIVLGFVVRAPAQEKQSQIEQRKGPIIMPTNFDLVLEKPALRDLSGACMLSATCGGASSGSD